MRIVTIVSVASVMLMLYAPFSHAQKVYTWKDSSGTMHYSDTPPPRQHKARELTLDEHGEAKADPLPAKAASAPSAALEKAEDNYEVRACASAKADLDKLNKGGLIVSGNDVSTAKKLNAADIAKAKAAANKRVAEFCTAKKK